MEEYDDLDLIPFQKVNYAINKHSDSKSCQEKRNRQQNVEYQQEIFKKYDSFVQVVHYLDQANYVRHDRSHVEKKERTKWSITRLDGRVIIHSLRR